MEKVGLAACSTDMDGCCTLVLLSNCGGWTGGGCLAPLVEEAPSSSGSLDTFDVAVCGLVLVLEANSFTGGVGAAGSSTGSAPSGPSGPVESSRLSRVVDWVSLTCRRGPRDLEGAGLADMGEAVVVVGAGAAAASVEGVCSASSVSTVGYATCQEYAYRLVVRYPLLPWRGYGLIQSARGRLRKGGQLARDSKAGRVSFTYRPTASLLPP